jgi:ElaB/YqjD/DUF883 family membrane-anchored ribosome-binding protein
MDTNRYAAEGQRIADDAHAELLALRAKVEQLMAERVTPAVTRLAGQAEDAVDYANDAVRDQAERLSATVREQPLTALGAAALAGFVLALLFKR